MGPLALLSLFGVVVPLIGDGIKAEQAVKTGREHVETVRLMESYRYGPHTLSRRRAFVSAVAPRLSDRVKFMAPALLSAKTQWQTDVTVGLIEMEMFR